REGDSARDREHDHVVAVQALHHLRVFRLWSRGSSPGFTFARQLHPVRGPPHAALRDQLRHDAHVGLGEALRRHLRADRAHPLAAALPHPVADGPSRSFIGGFASLSLCPPPRACYSLPKIFYSLPILRSTLPLLAPPLASRAP